MNSPDGDPNCAVMHFANTKEDKIKEMIRAYKVFMDLPDADETLFRQINNLLIEARIDEWEKLFLPTHPAIAKKRGWKEDEWRGYLGLPIAGRDNQYL